MIPLFIGADEMAWPRMNALGAGYFRRTRTDVHPFITNLLGLTGLPDNAGWFAYPPLRSMLNTSGTDFAIMSIWVLGVASLTGGGINFFVTIINERKPELGWFDLPIWIWTVMFTNLLAIYSIPWLLDAWSMVWLERNLGMAFFNARMGGDPLLYQWIWWTFGHPEVYVLVLPEWESPRR